MKKINHTCEAVALRFCNSALVLHRLNPPFLWEVPLPDYDCESVHGAAVHLHDPDVCRNLYPDPFRVLYHDPDHGLFCRDPCLGVFLTCNHHDLVGDPSSCLGVYVRNEK